MRYSLIAAAGALAGVLGAAGCAPAPRQTQTTFDRQEVAWATGAGTATIAGQAFMRQTGGGVVTCAGEEVALIPVGRYSTERITLLYGNDEGGVNRIQRIAGSPPADFEESKRSSRCDAQGNFRFNGLPAGRYYVVSVVRWDVGGSVQGGALMQRVTVTDGQRVEIILSPRL